MPKCIGGVSWKFDNNGSDRNSDLIVKDRFKRERHIKENMAEDGNTTPEERCMKPSQMFAAFGGSVKTPIKEEDKSQESPVAPKKKKTTFLWKPANQEELHAKDDDASKENTSDGNVCDSVDNSSSQLTFQPDVQTDVTKDHDAPVSDADIIQPSVSINDSVDHNEPYSTSPCEEASAHPEPVLDANANPELDIPANTQSMDLYDSKTYDEPKEDTPPPAQVSEEPSEDAPSPLIEGSNVENEAPLTEGSKVESEVEPTKDQSDAGEITEEPAASSETGNENVEQPDGETEAPPRPSAPVPTPQPPAHHPNHQNGPADDPRIRHDIQNSHPAASSQPPVPEVPRTAPPATPPAPPAPQGGPPEPPQTSPQNSAPVPPGPPPAAPPAPPGPPPPPGGAGGPPAPPGGAGGPPAPPGPPPPPGGGGPPAPPPPPPPPGAPGGAPKAGGGNDLAAQIAAAKLKKASAPKAENGGDKGKREGGPGGMSMMADLQRKLAARQQKSEGGGDSASSTSKEKVSPPEPARTTEPKTSAKPWERKNITNGITPGSPKTERRGSVKNSASSNGSADNVDFDKMKQEIMTEMRKEISKMKEEIIEAIKMELNRR